MIYPLLHRHPAPAKWYDTRDFVFIEFIVADSKDVQVNFEKTKFGFRYVCLILALSKELKLYLTPSFCLLAKYLILISLISFSPQLYHRGR